MIKKIKNTLIVSALLFSSSPATAELIAYEVLKEKSFLKFVAMQNNAPVSAKFTDFDAGILFDFDYPGKSSIKVTVATGSIEASYDEIKNNVVKPDWLSVKAFPKAVFETTKISKIPSTWNYYAEGNLTLRGMTAPVIINFQIEDLKDRVIVDGSTTVKRSNYGVGQGQWTSTDVVKDLVRVEFRIVALKKSKK